MRTHRPCFFQSKTTALTIIVVLAGGITAGSQTLGTPAGEPLFDGKTLTNWQPSKFHGQGTVTIENGDIILGSGKDLTGITWSGSALPNTNYELTLQARRLEGRDFFAGVTFPVGDSFCSLILGGWGGTMVGLSSINGIDASENSTSQSIDFEMQRWYDIRIRVTPEKIDSWLDGKHIIEQPLKGNQISVRIEVEPSQPLGIASWRTKAGLKDIRLRRLN
jgi:3-keto-disaccharide hydrolase